MVLEQIQRLTELVYRAAAQVAPITGVSIGTQFDRATWEIRFKPEATQSQRDAAQAAILVVDVAPDPRSSLAQTLDTAIAAMPPIDPRIKAVFVEWRKQVS